MCRNKKSEAVLRRRYVFRMSDPEFPEDRRQVTWTVRHMLRYVNFGHSSRWINYDASDWREGVCEWTGWKVVRRVR